MNCYNPNAGSFDNLLVQNNIDSTINLLYYYKNLIETRFPKEEVYKYNAIYVQNFIDFFPKDVIEMHKPMHKQE